MRHLTLALALALPACGPRASTALPLEDQHALCAPLAAQVGGAFACRTDELIAGGHTAKAEARYRVEVTFRPDGRVARFDKLRADVELGDAGHRAPDCVATTVRALHLPERAEGLEMPLTLVYRRGAAPEALLRKGRCVLTSAPGGP